MTAIADLPPAEILELAKCFEEFHAQFWDQQIERDLNAGRLDSLLDEAKQDLNAITGNRCEAPGLAALLAALSFAS